MIYCPPPPSGSITSNTNINDADTTELITAAQNCNLGAVQNLIGNSNFEITAEITRAYQAVEQKCWSSDHEPSNSCCQTNDFIFQKIYNKLKEYINTDDVASMEEFANLSFNENYGGMAAWVCPYDSLLTSSRHPSGYTYTDNLLYYTIDKDSEQIFEFLAKNDYLDPYYCGFGKKASYDDVGFEKNPIEIILTFPNPDKALKYTKLYADILMDTEYLTIDEVVGSMCSDSEEDDSAFIQALNVGNLNIFKWCLNNGTPFLDPDSFYYDDYMKYDGDSAYEYISEQCNNGKQIYCEAKEYSEQWMCDTIKKYPEDFTITDFDGLTCN